MSTPRSMRACLLAVLAGLVPAACTSSPPTPGSSVVIAPDQAASAQSRSHATDPPSAGSGAATQPSSPSDPNDPQAAADAHARRLNEALARLAEPAVDLDSPDASPQVLWLDPAPQAQSEPADQPSDKPAVVVAESSPKPAEPPAATQPSLMAQQQQLLDQLRAAMLGSSNPQLLQAVVAAASTPPSPAPAAVVPVVSTVAEPAAPDSTTSSATMDAPVLHIRTLELCKRVESFGVYDPIDSTSLLVGRPARMIVYVELDHFRSQKVSDQGYRVHLTQEVTLYNEADGLAVWQQPPVEIQDESRNVRRDFFVVQVIELPARLSVGKYILKVRVTDQQAQTFDESTTSIHIVADSSVAQAATPGSTTH